MHRGIAQTNNTYVNLNPRRVENSKLSLNLRLQFICSNLCSNSYHIPEDADQYAIMYEWQQISFGGDIIMSRMLDGLMVCLEVGVR